MNDLKDSNNENFEVLNIPSIIKSNWKILIYILISSLIIHTLLWMGWPLHEGGDGITYIYYYIDSFNQTPVYHNLLCFRLPIAPFLFGTLLSLSGSLLTSIALELISLSSILMIFLVARTYGKWTAIISSTLLILMFSYQIQYHQITSDGIFAWFIILFIFLYHFSIYNNSIKLWLLLGISAALATITRPNGLALILIILTIPFLKFGWKRTIIIIITIIISFSFLVGSYILYKGIRYKDFSLTRDINTHLFYRIYRKQYSAIKYKNGVHTQKFIKIVEENVLNSNNYRNYKVDIDSFLNYKPNNRFFSDSLVIVDLVEGWGTDHKLLGQVSLEAIKAHPKIFLSIYLQDLFYLITLNPSVQNIPTYLSNIEQNNNENIELNEDGFLIPTEGELITKPNYWWLSTRPDKTFPTESQIAEFNEEVKILTNKYKRNSGNIAIKNIFDYIWGIFYIPTTYFWIFGILGIIFSRNRDRKFLISLALLYIIIIAGTVLGTSPWPRYRLPLDPMLLLFGTIGFSRFIKFLKEKSGNNPYNPY